MGPSRSPAGSFKRCSRCGVSNVVAVFRDRTCKPCHARLGQAYRSRPEYAAQQRVRSARWRDKDLARAMWLATRTRARRDGIPFDISREDISIPEFCPVLGIRLEAAKTQGKGGRDHSPSIDRIIPALGYVRGNIAIISNRANRIKSDATPAEVDRVLQWMRKQESHDDP